MAPGTHSETGASEPRGDRLDNTEDFLVSVFMKLGLSRNDFHADAPLDVRLFAVNAESRMSCALGCVDAQRRTLIAASLDVRVKDAYMKSNISLVFLRELRRLINNI